MDIEQLRKQSSDEDACRSFFESFQWKNGRVCPHCFNEKGRDFSANRKNDWLKMAKASKESGFSSSPSIYPA
jgi:hypothetical protein